MVLGGNAQSLEEAKSDTSCSARCLARSATRSHSISSSAITRANRAGGEGARATASRCSVRSQGRRSFRIPTPMDSTRVAPRRQSAAGPRENYYAWEWGDALFVVLDPFWNTMSMPHRTGGYESSNDAWDWTLGLDQYNWLYETLSGSDATWKFVFSHHVTGRLPV